MKTQDFSGMPLPETLLKKLPNPAYVLDKGRLERNFALIRSVAEETGVEIILALKGFSMWGAFPAFKEAGFSQSTSSSLCEARLAFEELGKPSYTYAAAYLEEEIDEIASVSSHLTFNSLNQYERFASRAKAVNPALSFGLRVNPGLESDVQAIYNPCVPGSRLGVMASYLPGPGHLPEGLEGFHCHALCESDAKSSCALLDAFEQHFAAYLPDLKWVNFGGGHLMTAQGYDLDLLKKRLRVFRERWPHLQVILEPGAAFVWEAGYLVGRVEDVVESGGIRTAIMNVSFADHMPDCLEIPYQPKVFGSIHAGTGADVSSDPVPGEKHREDYRYRYRLGGGSCLAGDFMGDWLFKEELHPGHLLVFNDMAHYTFVKTTTFNGLKHPAICFTEGTEILYCREFGYEDFRRKLS